jgi:hypothetical protein
VQRTATAPLFRDTAETHAVGLIANERRIARALPTDWNTLEGTERAPYAQIVQEQIAAKAETDEYIRHHNLSRNTLETRMNNTREYEYHAGDPRDGIIGLGLFGIGYVMSRRRKLVQNMFRGS